MTGLHVFLKKTIAFSYIMKEADGSEKDKDKKEPFRKEVFHG